MVAQTIDQVKIIKEYLRVAQDRQNKWTYHHRRSLEFEIGDIILLKVLPMKRVARFGRRGKLNHRYINPFATIKRVGNLAY